MTDSISLYSEFQATVRRQPQQTISQRERQLENNRRQEEVREETLRNLGREKMLESNMNRESRLEDKRFIRTQMMEQKEREMEETMLKVIISVGQFRPSLK